jgi:hypothetical protein
LISRLVALMAVRFECTEGVWAEDVWALCVVSGRCSKGVVVTCGSGEVFALEAGRRGSDGVVGTVSGLQDVPSVKFVCRLNSSMNCFKALTCSGELSVIK